MDNVMTRPENVTADNVFFLIGRWYMDEAADKHAGGTAERFLADVKELAEAAQRIPNKDMVGFGSENNWGVPNFRAKTALALEFMRTKGFMVWNADDFWSSIVATPGSQWDKVGDTRAV